MLRALVLFTVVLFGRDAFAACTMHVMGSYSSTTTVPPAIICWICDTDAEKPNGVHAGDLVVVLETGAMLLWNNGQWNAMGGGSGAPTDAQYIVGAANGTLTAEIVATAAGLALLDDADAAAQRTTLGLGALATLGTVGSSQIDNDAVTYAKLQNVTDARLLGRSAGSAGDAQEIAVGSGLSLSAGTLSATGGGGMTVVRKAADQASTSTSFADVSGLSFALSSGTAYSFDCYFSYVAAATTTALQLSVNGPASPTAMRYTVETATTATARHNASQAAYDTVVNPATSGGSTALPVQIHGSIENGANAGTLALRMRTEVSGSSVTVQRGSHCEIH